MAKGWAGKSKWTAEEWRNYRRAKGIPPKSDMPTIIPPHVTAAGKELALMMACPILDWPTDLYAARDTTAPLFAPKAKTDHLCPCGCGVPHKHAVSRAVKEGGHNRIFWYPNMRCRNKHAGVK